MLDFNSFLSLIQLFFLILIYMDISSIIDQKNEENNVINEMLENINKKIKQEEKNNETN